MINLEIGIVIEVNGFINKVATFDNTNHSNIINKGKLIKNVSVNSFILIQQGFVKIVARINSESIWDVQKSNLNIDNRFKKGSIKRILEVQTIGYIKNNKFYTGSSYLPMIGNFCSIPNDEEINLIYINNYVESGSYPTISVGKSLVEHNVIDLPINNFFASHIGIFGNTGSGKSNTMHKLYYELFKIDNFPKMKNNSKFLILDFNDEYTQENSFGKTIQEGKKIYKLSSRGQEFDKYPILMKTFFNTEMLSVLFQATIQTQRPFLHRVVVGINKYGLGAKPISDWIGYLIKQIFKGYPNQNIRDRLVSILKDFYEGIDMMLNKIESTEVFSGSNGDPCFRIDSYYFNGDWTEEHDEKLNIDNIKCFITNKNLSNFQEFRLRCNLQLISDLLYGNVISDHINPLLSRINTRIEDIEKYIIIVRELSKETNYIEIISLKELNQESKKIISLLVSKMYFDVHKSTKNNNSFHLIIDEAHNILSSQSTRENDEWKDYRLELFEEIIKEGRKFSFFLTISSQRPADISPTILSQVHNFFLHKLVNERDLQIIENSISTLDRISKSMLPILSQGVCIISGDALTMPIIVYVDFINDRSLRPKSDTIELTDIWE